MEVNHGKVVAADVDDGSIGVVDGGCRFSNGVGRQGIGERTNAHAAVEGARALVVTLQREGTVVKKALLLAPPWDDGRSRLDVVDEELAVQVDLHVLAAHGGVDAEGLFVGNQLLIHVAQAVERAGFLALEIAALAAGRVVDLDLEAFFREAGFLIGGMEIDAGVAIGLASEFDFKFKVAKVGAVHGAGVEQVGTGAIGSESTVDDFPVILVLAGLPAI